ncbi:probable acyl-[acyl-carrier-protein]--UDP-N-acetylglucosamine O-acyltransferase, mitochondrial isoform X2 [Ziziphus jujuba]|uniref:Probable acyl-[acyl-carrier-protein]--UDP-N-acetylglucosamine O-acyltransferase, mitochondrial isoform X2 n=1 Tax=Ziziphus jujuba TaxID=326968 RepID=A0ABM4AEE8_ZIZJJ|nr:probable acyl-[acyl-carrier-protein]--UDP-N-acetylglucosamine O-acyltransferase, mitochondrial isoform X2 [Ziziphus jujuba]
MYWLLKLRSKTTPLSSALSSFFLPTFSSASLSDIAGDKKEQVTNTSLIHPTAVVHPNAFIGQGVSIGPFCTVGSFAKLGNGCQLYPGSHIFGNTVLGAHCILMTGAVVGDDLPGHTVLGCNNIIGHHAVVGIKCQDMKYKPGEECFLDVGDDNEIREHTSIHRSSKSSDRTVIGNGNLIMGSSHIAHDCKVGNNNIFANNTLLAGHVVVGVSQDVPKYMMVSGERAELRGLNLEGLRRHRFTAAEIRSLRAAYRKIFMPANENVRGFEERLAEVEQHEELANDPSVCSMVQSIRDSFEEKRRGICKFRQWSGC